MTAIRDGITGKEEILGKDYDKQRRASLHIKIAIQLDVDAEGLRYAEDAEDSLGNGARENLLQCITTFKEDYINEHKTTEDLVSPLNRELVKLRQQYQVLAEERENAKQQLYKLQKSMH